MASIALVHDTPTPSANDAAFKTEMETRGHTVTNVVETDTPPTSGYDVIIISESGSGTTPASYDTNPLPVICFEVSWSSIRMSSADATAGSSQTTLDLLADSFGITNGLPDPLTYQSSAGSTYGVATSSLPSGVEAFAVDAGNASHAFGIVADNGATLTSGTAPNKRACMGLIDSRVGTLTSGGYDLVEAVVDWMAGSAQQINVGLVTETDSVPGALEPGWTSETDQALSITVGGDQNVPVEQVTETDLAQPMTAFKNPQYVAVGLVTETDTSQAMSQASLPGFITGIEPETHVRLGVIQDSNGNLYRITESFLAENNQPKMMKSTDGGVTWTEQDASNRPGSPSTTCDLESGCVTWDSANQLITFTWQASAPRIAQFRTSDHATNADTWVSNTRDDVASASPDTPQFMSHTKPTDQTYLWCFWGVSGGSSDYCTRAGQTGSSGTVNTVDASGQFPSAVLESDTTTTMIVYEKSSQLHFKELTSGGTLDGTSTRIDSSGVSDHADHVVPHAAPVAYSVNGSSVVSVMFTDLQEDIVVVDIVDGTPGSEQEVTTNPPAANEGTTASLQPIMSLAVDPTTKTLHAIWVDASTWDVMYASRPYGGSWTSPSTLVDVSTTAFTEVAFVTTSVIQRNGKNYLAYTYDLAPHADDASNVYYNELLISTPVAVGLVTETDTAQPVTLGVPALGFPTESDTAQAITSAKQASVGFPEETDTAQVLASAKSAPVTQVTETDTAQAITSSKTTAIAFPEETDAAQAITSAKQVAVAQVVETDLAQAMTASGNKNIAVGLVEETDTAQVVVPTITHRYIPVGQVVETDLAQAINSSGNKNIAVAQTVETDLAQAVAASKTQAIGLVTETDTAQAITVRKSATVGLASETDLAQPVSTPGDTQVPVNPASETDVAQAIVPTITRRYVTVGQAASTEVAGAIRPRRSYMVAQAVETDAATGVTVLRSYPVGQVQETATSLTISTAKQKSINLASETDEPGLFGDTLAIMYRRPSGVVPANSGGRAASGNKGGGARINQSHNGAELL